MNLDKLISDRIL